MAAQKSGRKPTVEQVFDRAGLSMGRSFGSKRLYHNAHPNRLGLVIWNANVFCRTKGKIWWGDFDLVTDKKKLRTVARRLRNRLYLLREHDGRFERENLPHRDVVKAAIWNTGTRPQLQRG
jgi:hypothetical protein